MGRAGSGPVDYGFDRAVPDLGLEHMGPGWSGPRVGMPVANTGVGGTIRPPPPLYWHLQTLHNNCGYYVSIVQRVKRFVTGGMVKCQILAHKNTTHAHTRTQWYEQICRSPIEKQKFSLLAEKL